jgi:SAM-dependent methyltransferase
MRTCQDVAAPGGLAAGRSRKDDGRPSRADVTVSYDLGVERYDQVWSPVILPAAIALLPSLGLVEGAVVLDVGTGAGALAPAIRDVAPGVSVVGVDASIQMLRVARSQRAVPVARADAMMLPVAATSVDAVVLAYVLFHLPDPAAALVQARQALRPGGRVGTVTWASERPEGAQKLWDRTLADAGVPPLPPRRSDAGLDSVDAMGRTLRAGGLTPVRLWTEKLCRQWDPGSFFALASRAGTSRQRLAGLDPAARSSLLDGLRARFDRLPPEAFWWEGEVICAVAAKEHG